MTIPATWRWGAASQVRTSTVPCLQTGDIPPEHWDFVKGAAVDKPTLHLGDHGDEISGLIEWQRVEMRRGLPEHAAHRAAINRMLDRLLETGRTPSGLWYDGISFPDGQVVDNALNDNWGYLGQAYLNQAELLRTAPDADLETAARYEAAVATMLHAASDLDFYPWERGDMDGYADALESALYLLHRLMIRRQRSGWTSRCLCSMGTSTMTAR